MEYHWINGNNYTLWYDDSHPGLRYGDKYPKSKDFFEALVEDYILDTPQKCGYTISNNVELILEARDYYKSKGLHP